MPPGGKMGIDCKDFMHGAALVAIAEDPRFTALNKASSRYGHYLINQDRNLFVKHCRKGGPEYQFTFEATELRGIRSCRPQARTFIAMVCAKEAVAALSADDLGTVVDLGATSAQWLRVVADPGRQLRFRGSAGGLTRPVPRNSFPDRVLG